MRVQIQREIGLAHARDVAEAMSALDPEELETLARLTTKLTSQED